MPSFEKDVTLAAATPTTVNFPLNGAPNWSAVVRNTGANPVTAATIARSPLGAPAGLAGPSPATAFPTGIPLAAGDSLTATGSAEKVTSVHLVFTSLLGTTLRIEGLC